MPTLTINVATWIVIASRSEPWTVSIIAEWLDRLRGGGILVLDEIDKIGTAADSSEWSRYVRLELHDVAQGIIPVATRLPIEETRVSSNPDPIGSLRASLEKKLREQVLILGCGAWQAAWRTNGKAIGFTGSADSLLAEAPSREQILKSIDPELRQRFRDELVLLPPMTPGDYLDIARQFASKVPKEALPAWELRLDASIERAAAGCLGMRAFEELLLEALIISGQGDGKGLPVREELRPPRLPSPSIW